MARKKRVLRTNCRSAGSRLKTRRSPQAGDYLSTFCQSKTARRKGVATRLKNAATKANGTLKKGYRYAKGGRIVRAKK